MSISEQRFREARGKQYQKDGVTVRCQGVAKAYLRKTRIEQQDPTITSEDVWPDGQCKKDAVPGTFLCLYHGGRSPTIEKQSVADYMPIDLQQKYRNFEGNFDAILNRQHEIKQLLARNAQLYEELDELVLGVEAYEAVAEAKRLLDAGKIVEASVLLRIALEDGKTERETWTEMRANNTLIDKLTKTHFEMAKDLKLMATVDQVKHLLEKVYRSITTVITKYVPDVAMREAMIREITIELRDGANIRGQLSG